MRISDWSSDVCSSDLGRDRRNPILLFIHGGPASTEMPVNWLYQGAWEDYFTVVQWDQRGAGKTAASNDAAAVTPTITIDRMTADGEALVAHLRSEEQPSDLQSIMRISSAVLCWEKKKK